MMSTRTQLNVANDRESYEIRNASEVSLGQRLWLQWEGSRNLIPVHVVAVPDAVPDAEIDDQTVVVMDKDGWEYNLYFSLGEIRLYTHWFRLF